MLKTIRDYMLVKKSRLFDENYYITQYPDVQRADINPLMHFVNTGWKEGRNPSAFFDTTFYLETYDDVKKAGINPLVHFIRFGARELRNPSLSFQTAYFVKNRPELLALKLNPLAYFLETENRECLQTVDTQILPVETKHIPVSGYPRFTSVNDIYWESEGLPVSDHVDIIICVGPNHQNIHDCLASIEKYTDLADCTVHLMINTKDRSSLQEISLPGAVIHEYSMERFNFSQVNNMVLKDAAGDVVLLNDDTEVTRGWLDKLRKASKGVALTGAHTNPHSSGNPDMWQEGPVITTDYPINMFCAYIPRRLREVVGLLDEDFVFYGGEDVDYSVRALRNGFPLVVSDAFVTHKDNRSFGETKAALMEESDKIILEKYGILSPFNLSQVKPYISIVMATHNRAHLLRAVVNAIQVGKYQDFELIIVDDASSDHTMSVIAELQAAFSNIVYIKLPASRGAAVARNVGVRAAKGDFIFFTDDDDMVLENRISSPLNAVMTHPELDIVYCNYTVTENGVDFQYSDVKEFDRQAYLDLEFAIGLGILFSRAAVLKNINLYSLYNHAGDYDLVFRLVRAGYKIDLCPDVVMIYNRTGHVDMHLAGTRLSAQQHKEVYNRELLLDSMVKHGK